MVNTACISLPAVASTGTTMDEKDTALSVRVAPALNSTLPAVVFVREPVEISIVARIQRSGGTDILQCDSGKDAFLSVSFRFLHAEYDL